MLAPSIVSLLALSSLAAGFRMEPIKASSDDKPSEVLETPTDGYVVGHLFPACNGRRLGGPKKPLAVPVDRCLTTPGLGMVIKTPAVCANGTRAKWARFTDNKCGHGTIDKYLGLIDIADSDVGKCLPTWNVDTPDEEEKQAKIASMSFWCEGVRKTNPEDDPKEPEQPKERKGSVSESACMVGKAPFFNHPKADTCVDLRTDRLKIFHAAVCANGTQAQLALYGTDGCMGGPTARLDITEDEMNKCLDVQGSSSFAFYCSGEGIESPPKKLPVNNGNNGSPLHFFLILALICMMFFLMLVLSVLAWVRKYGGGVGRLVEFFSGLFKPKDGSIAI